MLGLDVKCYTLILGPMMVSVSPSEILKLVEVKVAASQVK